MATATIRPNATVGSNNVTLTGAATVHGVLGDNSDATFLAPGSGGSYAEMDFATTTIPAGATVTSVQLSVRSKYTSVSDFSQATMQVTLSATTVTGSVSVSTRATSTTFGTVALSAQSMRSDGATWVQVDIDALRARIDFPSIPATGFQVADVWAVVTYNQAPSAGTVSVSSTSVTRPTVSWVYSDTEGDAQERYWVKVFVGTPTDPETDATVWDSGEVYSNTASSVQVGVDLTNGTAYKAYVKVAQRGGAYSSWANTSFTPSWTNPSAPTLTATADAANARVALAVSSAQVKNRLTAVAASGESNTTTSYTTAGTLTNVTTVTPQQGSREYKLDTGGVAGRSAVLASAGRPTAVTGDSWTASAYFQGVGVSQNVQVRIIFYDSGGSNIAQTTSGSTAAAAGSWTRVSQAATAPASTATVGLELLDGSTGAVYFDAAQLEQAAAVSAWQQGSGEVTSPVVTIELSDDAGTTWATVRDADELAISAAAGTVGTVYDHESPFNTARQYRARIITTGGGGAASANSATQSATLTSTLWWITDPQDPDSGGSLTVDVVDGYYDNDTVETMGVFRLLGRDRAVAVGDTVQGQDGTLTVEVVGTDDYEEFRALVVRQVPLLVRDPIESTTRWVRFATRSVGLIFGVDTSGMYRTLRLPYVEVDPPS